MKAAEALRQAGWTQKEYLSAGVVALSRAGAEEQLRCKLLACGGGEELHNEMERLRDAVDEAMHHLSDTCKAARSGHADEQEGRLAAETMARITAILNPSGGGRGLTRVARGAFERRVDARSGRRARSGRQVKTDAKPA